MTRSILALSLLAACGSPSPAGPNPAETTTATSDPPEPSPAETDPAEQAAPGDPLAADDPIAETTNEAEPPPGDLSVRVALEHPTMPAGASPSTDERARLDAVLYVRNGGGAPATVEMVIPLASQLDWRLTAADGTVWRPTFLPPPMPRPGGPPRTTVTVPPGGEAQVAALHGISGFFRESADPSTFGPLPRGTYEVVVSDIRLGDGAAPRTAPPVTLVVR